MLVQSLPFPARGRIPEPDDLVVTRRRERQTIGQIRHTTHPAGVTAQRQPFALAEATKVEPLEAAEVHLIWSGLQAFQQLFGPGDITTLAGLLGQVDPGRIKVGTVGFGKVLGAESLGLLAPQRGVGLPPLSQGSRSPVLRKLGPGCSIASHESQGTEVLPELSALAGAVGCSRGAVEGA